MFPIARAIVGANQYGGKLVFPTIRQIKIGTFLRGEADKRIYGDVLRERKIREWWDWVSVNFHNKIPEAEYDGRSDGAVIYDGLRNYFEDIVDHESIIKRWILSNANINGALIEEYDIGVHIRQGDFAHPNPIGNVSNTRLPLEWYASAVAKARDLIGEKSPRIFLFTDQFDKWMLDVLGEVVRDPAENAITSILNLSKARIIVASNSTFSMWGAYLGKRPAVWDSRYKINKMLPRSGLNIEL